MGGRGSIGAPAYRTRLTSVSFRPSPTESPFYLIFLPCISPQSAAYASGAPWIQWPDATFTDFATLCNDPALLGKALLKQVLVDNAGSVLETAALTTPIEVRWVRCDKRTEDWYSCA